MYGVASEISARAAFSVPAFLFPLKPTYTQKKKHTHFNTAQVS